jgi:hypothetical protein
LVFWGGGFYGFCPAWPGGVGFVVLKVFPPERRVKFSQIATIASHLQPSHRFALLRSKSQREISNAKIKPRTGVWHASKPWPDGKG